MVLSFRKYIQPTATGLFLSVLLIISQHSFAAVAPTPPNIPELQTFKVVLKDANTFSYTAPQIEADTIQSRNTDPDPYEVLVDTSIDTSTEHSISADTDAPSNVALQPRIGVHDGYTRVVLDLPPNSASLMRTVADTLYIDFPALSFQVASGLVGSSEVEGWRIVANGSGSTVAIDTRYPLKNRRGVKTLILEPSSDSNFQRLVLDFSPRYAANIALDPETQIKPFALPVQIVLDAGHGGQDPGAVSPDGQLYEKDVTLHIALLVRNLLQQAGASVVLTRNTDRALGGTKVADLAARANLASPPSTAMVSIHVNSNPKGMRNPGFGIETWYYPNTSESAILANTLQNSLQKWTDGYIRSVHKGNLQVLRQAEIPAALVEVGFINHPSDLKLLKNESYLQQLAFGIAAGIREFVQPSTLPLAKR